MKNSIILSIIVISSVFSFAQDKKMKRAKVKPGIIYLNGEEIRGYIKISSSSYVNGKRLIPGQNFQKRIKFISEADYDALSVVKNKNFTKYRPFECDGYEYNGQYYRSVRVQYGTFGGGGSMFLEEIVTGKINLYQYYAPENAQRMGPEDTGEYLLYQKGTMDDCEMIQQLNVKSDLGDCPIVLERYRTGKYNVINKRSKFLNILNKGLFRYETNLRAVEDYNVSCN